MRGREFVMKDMYSFHTSAEGLEAYYNKTIDAYKRVYDRLGIGEDTYVTFASGGAFTKFSHEFQTICDAGEDIIYLHREKNVAVNEEVIDDAVKELDISRDELEQVKTAEVGNIFNFGAQKTDEMDLYFTNEAGEQSSLYIGSYGIGVTRVMGVIAEKLSDEKGLVWPENVAPFAVYLAQLGNDKDVIEASQKMYDDLVAKGVEVFWDDRDVRPGEKFADADLYGIPYRVVVSQKTVGAGQFELKKRTESDVNMVTYEELVKALGY